MPKRKREDAVDTEYLLKKLKRLERKIKKKRASPVTSEEDDLVDDQPLEEMIDSPEICNEITPPTIQTTDTSKEVEILDESIIKVLGKSYNKPPEMGEKIHKDIADRWENILQNGIDKEEKENLLKNTYYRPPENCPHLMVPKMNAEALAACAEHNKKRDSLIEARQELISKCISGLACATQKVLVDVQPQDLKLNLIEILNNTGKVLSDIFFNENKNRRNLVVSGLEKDVRDTLIQTKPDKYLFGENLYEKIKTAKSVGKTGREIRLHPKNTTKPRQDLPTRSVNWRGPPRPAQRPMPLDSRTNKSRQGGPRQAPQKRAPPAAPRSYRKQNSYNNTQTQRT